MANSIPSTTTTTTDTTTPSTPPTFMTLPSEIRCHIYSFILLANPITYKPRLPPFHTIKSSALILNTHPYYSRSSCHRRTHHGHCCAFHADIWESYTGFLCTMLEPIPSPYSILFANKRIADEFLHVVYKHATFTFELCDISTRDFAQWDVSRSVLERMEFVRFQFDLNERGVLVYDPDHRELCVPEIVRSLPRLRRMDAAIVLREGMNDDEDDEDDDIVKGAGKVGEEDRRTELRRDGDTPVDGDKEKRRLTNVFEVPVAELCKAPAGQQCYLIS